MKVDGYLFLAQAAIPHLLEGRDLLGSAQTGTGKTAAFALPILQRLGLSKSRPVARCPKVLVLSPTRELAVQICESFETYGKHLHFRQTTVFGGVGQIPQVRALQRGVHIVVATPGRLLDLIEQGHLELSQLEVFVLDESDRMLDMGFLPDLKRIISMLPKERQSLFFSATFPDRIAELARNLLKDPVKVTIAPKTNAVELIEQRVMFCKQLDKKGLLADVLEKETLAVDVEPSPIVAGMATVKGGGVEAPFLAGCDRVSKGTATAGSQSEDNRIHRQMKMILHLRHAMQRTATQEL